jgi:hypothetical protein
LQFVTNYRKNKNTLNGRINWENTLIYKGVERGQRDGAFK